MSARSAKPTVDRELAIFHAGQGGCKTLLEIVSNDAVALTARLDAIDIAISRGVFTIDEIKCTEPVPISDAFGLPSDQPPSVLPSFMRPDREDTLITNNFGIAVIAIIGFVLGIGWSAIEHKSILLTIALAPAYGVGGMLWTCIAFSLAVLAANSLLPSRRSYNLYRDALDRHKTLMIIRDLKQREYDVRAYQRASGAEFKRLTARAFRRKHWSVEELGGANDGGVDLIVTKGSRRGIVQCKAHAKPISPAVVRDLFGALSHSGASFAMLASTSGPSTGARAWAAGKPIYFISPDDLVIGRGF